MKNLTPFLLLPVILVTGCNLFDKVDDISFETELSESLTASDNTTGTNRSVSQTLTLDALDNAEIEPYKDKLKGITVQEVRYEITNFTGDNTSTLTGNVVVKDGSTPVATVAISSFNLNEAFTAGTVYTLPLTAADYTAISNLLLESKTAAVTVEGTLSKTPVNAVIKFTFVVNVKAEVLK